MGLYSPEVVPEDKRSEKFYANTAIWVVSVVGISTVLGFIIAMALNTEFFGRKIARSIVIFPWATSLVIQASVWNYIIKY